MVRRERVGPSLPREERRVRPVEKNDRARPEPAIAVVHARTADVDELGRRDRVLRLELGGIAVETKADHEEQNDHGKERHPDAPKYPLHATRHPSTFRTPRRVATTRRRNVAFSLRGARTACSRMERSSDRA